MTTADKHCSAGSNCDQIQGSNITQVEQKEGEEAFNIASIFQIPHVKMMRFHSWMIFNMVISVMNQM